MKIENKNSILISSKVFDRLIAFIARIFKKAKPVKKAENPKYFHNDEYNKQVAKQLHEDEINRIKAMFYSRLF